MDMPSTSAENVQADALVSDTLDPEKPMHLRMEAVERATAALNDRLDDLGRQISKACIDFKGPALRRRFGETPFRMIQRIVGEYWGRQLHILECSDAHFTTEENVENPRFIVRFNDRKDESNFAWILRNKPNWNGREKVFANLHLHTANDRKLLIAARQMKKTGKVCSFRHAPSGRLEVTFSDGKTRVFGKAKDLEKLAKSAASKEAKKDQGQGKRSTR